MPDSESPPNQNDYTGPSNQTLAIFLISVLGLFLEIMLIRWIGTEVRIFAYLQNTVLVVSFLGLGLGCFTSLQAIDLRRALSSLFFLVLILAIPISRKGLGSISEMLNSLQSLYIFLGIISTSTSQTILFMVLGLALTFFLMVLILDIFVPIGRLLARLINNHPHTIWAYSVNIAGSLAGTWLFVLLSVLYFPPVIWFSVIGVLFFFLIGKPNWNRKLEYSLLFGVIVLSWLAGTEPGSIEVVWSPYQKLVLRRTDQKRGEIGKYLVNVNNIRYQDIIDFDPIRGNSVTNNSFPEKEHYSQYDIQLLLHPNPEKMLIVGAGTGNDASAALRHKIKEITAVEIDPAILSLGQRYHPNRPYDSSLVKIINDDARSFFANCKDRFDVISFGLLDSHTTGVMTNIRLDDYVYTRESIMRAKHLLKDGGIICLHFGAGEYYVFDRLANVLRDVFNQQPISFVIPKSDFGLGGVMFVVGDQTLVKQQIAKNMQLKSVIEKWQRQYPLNFSFSTLITTDDWPYLYLRTKRIPILYYLLAGLMFLLLIRSQRHWKATGLIARWKVSHWHFFFLGAAFMLLEVQNISKASVALGSTWWVNAVIISGVLCMILLSNIIAAKLPKMPLAPVYILLCGTCVSLYFIDIAQFAFLPYVLRAIIVGGLTTLPMIFSGIVFIVSFANVDKKDEALGANLIGALVGALLQSITFITGIKALLLVVTGLYFLAVLIKPRSSGGTLLAR